jgi:signal transduction histidine kinase
MPAVISERTPLQQVFMNLLSNAVKHGGATDVRVSAVQQGEYWRFSVQDNGSGIAREYHEKIFGIFQTLVARDKVEGTGIGLAVVKKLVERYRGAVRVDSEVGKGATFSFTWPDDSSRVVKQ